MTTLPTGKRGRKAGAKTRGKTAAKTKTKGKRKLATKGRTKGKIRAKSKTTRARNTRATRIVDERHQNMVRDWDNIAEHLRHVAQPLQSFGGMYLDRLGNSSKTLAGVQTAIAAAVSLEHAIHAVNDTIRLPA